jgi:predicted RNA polymerase sigma factor
MAQRISRAKRRIAGLPLDQPGDLGTVLSVLYLVFNEGYSGNVDLAAEAIRLTYRTLVLSVLYLVFNEGYSGNVDLAAEAIRLTYRTLRRDSRPVDTP